MMGRLGRNVVANIVAAGAMVVTGIVSIPVIVDEIGLANYGVWTLALAAIIYITTAEAGIGTAVQRFAAVAHGGADVHAVARLLWSTVALYLAVGAVVVAALALFAPALVDAFEVAPRTQEDAEAMFRIAGLAALLALLAAGLGNVQQGLERYYAYTMAGATGAAVLLAGIVIAMRSGAGLSGLAWAAVAQQSLILTIRVWNLRDVVTAALGLVSGGEARGIGGFAMRTQMTVATLIVTMQTDRVVVGLVDPGRTLGQLGIGAQVAEAGRLVGGAVLAPIVSRMSVTHGADPAALPSLFERLQRLWTLGVLGGTVIGIATLHPLIETWIGPGHGEAVLLGSILAAGHGINLLIGTGIAYLRAIGKVGIEARTGAVTIATNVVLIVALGIAFGAVGVVSATLCAFTVGALWFYRGLREEAPGVVFLPPPRAMAGAIVAGALSLGWGVLMADLCGRWLGLVPVMAGAAASFVAYLAWVTGVRPSAANIRALLA